MAVQLNHPANAVIVAYLKRSAPNATPSQSPEQADTWHLGTHPDLVDYLWGTAPEKLLQSCAWAVYQSPVLVHPDTGVIFAIAGGTHTLAFRLPDAERAAIPQDSDYAKNFGVDWALVPTFDKRVPDWCLSAYEYVGTLIS